MLRRPCCVGVRWASLWSGRLKHRAAYGTKAFVAEYEAALAGQPAPVAKGVTVGTMSWLIGRYMVSAHWTEALSTATRAQRSGILKETVRIAGTEPIEAISARAIREGLDRRAARPHGANNWLKTMRGLFAFAVEREYLQADPTRGVKLLGGPNDRNGFHTWTEDEVARFEVRWPLGTRERLALDLLLYTGLRRGDAARVGRPHVRNGRIRDRDGEDRPGRDDPDPSAPCRSIAAESGRRADLHRRRARPADDEGELRELVSGCLREGRRAGPSPRPAQSRRATSSRERRDRG